MPDRDDPYAIPWELANAYPGTNCTGDSSVAVAPRPRLETRAVEPAESTED